MAFDVQGAKQAGYSDTEIADHLAADANFDAAAARKSGYSDKELISHLAAPEGTPPVTPGSVDEYGRAIPDVNLKAPGGPIPAPYTAAPIFPGGPTGGGIGDPGTLTGAIAEGWRNAPSFWGSPGVTRQEAHEQGVAPSPPVSPEEARQKVANLPVSGPILAGAGDIFSGIMGAGNALLRGLQFTGANVAEPIGNAINIPAFTVPGTDIHIPQIGGPGLGRDVAALPEAFPAGAEIAPERPRYAGGTSGAPPPPRPQFVGERTAPPRLPGMTDAERMRQLIQHDIVETNPAPSFVPPGTPRPDMPPPAPMNEILRSDPTQAFGRPAEIPPTTTKDPVTGEVQPIQQPSPAESAPQTVWRSQDHDFPVEPTGVTHAAQDGRIYAQVRQPDGTLSYVPHDELVTTQPAGAQITPAAQSTLTPEQEAAAGSTADKQWYYKTIIPGEADRVQYIKGINPTMAQQELTTNAARDSKLLRRISEDADQNERELLGRHSVIRKGEFQDIAGSDTTQETALDNANKQIEAQLQAAYAHGGTVDLQPVVDAANAELTGSAGKLPPVKSAMKQIVDAAQKDDGSGLETSPLQANAVRRAIIYMQSKKGQLENPGYGDPDVMAALTRVKDTLTKQIEPAAPGFTAANANYAKARQAIDAREALQAYEPKLYQGPLGNMTFAPMHRLMGDVIAGRDPRASPINPYKALTEEQMNRLKSLHDDLQRVSSAEELARAAGSDTSTTLFDMAKKAVRGGLSTLGGAGVGMLVGHVWPEAAVSAGMFTKNALDSMFSQQAVRRATAEHNQLLQPDLTKYPLKPNPLMLPPGAP